NNQEAIVETLRAVGQEVCNEEQIAAVLLFMIVSHRSEEYSPDSLVQTIRRVKSAQEFSWQALVSHFDKEAVSVNPVQFSKLFEALLPVAQEDSNFDIQRLWGGEWAHRQTQFSFLGAFLSSEIDTSVIPNYRAAF